MRLISSDSSETIEAADRLVANGEGELVGSLHPSIDKAVHEAGMDALEKRRSRMYSIDPSEEGGSIVGIQGGSVEIFAEVLASRNSLVIVGAGHIAQPLAAFGKVLGFTVTVIDDRSRFASRERFPDADQIVVSNFVEGLQRMDITRDSFVVLVTRGHVHDHECLRHVLNTRAGYIGMIGSKIRIRTVMRSLKTEGFSDEDLRRVYGPVGIDIGSQTPAEIALAIAAEIVDIQRGGKAPHLTIRDRLGG